MKKLPEDVLTALRNPDNETGMVEIIKTYLRTPKHKKMLDSMDLSIEDCLNGRYGGVQEAKIQRMYKEWNKVCGEALFGDERSVK